MTENALLISPQEELMQVMETNNKCKEAIIRLKTTIINQNNDIGYVKRKNNFDHAQNAQI